MLSDFLFSNHMNHPLQVTLHPWLMNYTGKVAEKVIHVRSMALQVGYYHCAKLTFNEPRFSVAKIDSFKFCLRQWCHRQFKLKGWIVLVKLLGPNGIRQSISMQDSKPSFIKASLALPCGMIRVSCHQYQWLRVGREGFANFYCQAVIFCRNHRTPRCGILRALRII